MQKKEQFRWKELFEISEKKTNLCKICNKEIEKDSFHSFLNPNVDICFECYKKFNLLTREEKFHGYDLLILYQYKYLIRSTIYQFKACGDIVLKRTFLEYIARELHFKYLGYLIIPAPSSEEGDEKRGFNHVEEIFSCLNLSIEKLVYKIDTFKQTEQTFKGRLDIGEHIAIKDGQKLRNRNVLLVDDVKTTGSTLAAMIKLIKPFNPKKIKILVLSSPNVDKNHLIR